jgi:hypothetical protein
MEDYCKEFKYRGWMSNLFEVVNEVNDILWLVEKKVKTLNQTQLRMGTKNYTLWRNHRNSVCEYWWFNW